MASRGRQARVKGSGQELKLAKLLSAWTGQTFVRVPMSGANHQQKGEINMIGDITAPTGSNNSFNYESKKHEAVNVKQVMFNNGEIPSFWEQVVTDSGRVVDGMLSPMLIFTKNYEPNYVLVPYTEWLVTNLQDKLLPCQVQKTSYVDSVSKKLQVFDTILTTLDAVMEFNPDDVFKLTVS